MFFALVTREFETANPLKKDMGYNQYTNGEREVRWRWCASVMYHLK
jgi:hypothetical protein